MTSSSPWILIVDDDEDIRFMLGLVLEMRGFQAIGVGDGNAALDHLRSAPAPGLVLLDLRMPRMAGTDLLARMKADPQLENIPVVVLSGDNAAGEIASCMAAEASLKKPIDVGELVDIISRFVKPTMHRTQ